MAAAQSCPPAQGGTLLEKLVAFVLARLGDETDRDISIYNVPRIAAVLSTKAVCEKIIYDSTTELERYHDLTLDDYGSFEETMTVIHWNILCLLVPGEIEEPYRLCENQSEIWGPKAKSNPLYAWLAEVGHRHGLLREATVSALFNRLYGFDNDEE